MAARPAHGVETERFHVRLGEDSWSAIELLVEDGIYLSASDAIRDAIRRLSTLERDASREVGQYPIKTPAGDTHRTSLRMTPWYGEEIERLQEALGYPHPSWVVRAAVHHTLDAFDIQQRRHAAVTRSEVEA